MKIILYNHGDYNMTQKEVLPNQATHIQKPPQAQQAQQSNPTPTQATQPTKQGVTTPTTPPEPIIKPLNPNMTQVLNEQIDYLSEHNSGIQSMNYYYQLYKELYGNRARELLHAKSQGKKIIGTFCNFIPLELIIAADAVPLRLCTGFQDPILPSEEILPRNFCPLIKSSYGISLMDSPHYDLVDIIIIPTTCDGKKKLAEILSENKQTWVIEVPHTTETPQARRLWLTEMQLIKKQLEKLTGNKITAKKLKEAIDILNKKRAVSRRLYELRRRTPPPIWGRDAMLVTNLSLYDDVKRWTERTETLCNELEKHKPVCDISIPRIMLTGSPTVFPTWKVPVLTEESGGVIVMDDICTGSKEFWDPIETMSGSMNDMLIAISDKYLMNTCACFTPNLVRLNRIIQFAEEFKIDGVIYHVLQACHIYGMEELRIEKALEKIKIPILNIETDYSQEDVEQIRTRVEAFLEMVSIRKMSKPSGAMPPTVGPPSEPLPTSITTATTPSPITAQSQPSTPVHATATSTPPQTTDPTAALATPTPPQATDPTTALATPTPPQAPDPTAALIAQTPPQANDPTQATSTTTSAPPSTPVPPSAPPAKATPSQDTPATPQSPIQTEPVKPANKPSNINNTN
jgi:benzoyl-CoA reductase/2-hydroxyglutaryl-CoA dehydratase subunit BcrC/BadD/HgdB